MFKPKEKTKPTSILLSDNERKAVKEGAKMYSTRKNKLTPHAYMKGSIITQLKSDGLLPK